ncbi:MAG TPA: c-type cytochrome [Nitrospirota bacterium]|nr:c-type cytochrome [Nitrospirota bacterium]
MKKIIILLSVTTLFSIISNSSTGGDASSHVGEALYNKHCLACHPDAEKLSSTKNIVWIMRSQIASMPQFDENKISDDNAKKIEDYIHQNLNRTADLCGNNMTIRR